MTKYIYISKLDAAKRELEMAIRLFFSNSDMVAVYSLAAAAHEILRGLCTKQKIKSFIKDTMVSMIKKEKQGEYWKMITRAQNFFKHAEKDHDQLLKFYLEPTEYFLWDACGMYQTLTKESPPLIQVFNMWFYLKNPRVVQNEKIKNLLNEFRLNLDPENRPQFLELLLPLATKIKN